MSGICRRHAERGLAGLTSGPRGPVPGTGRFLTPQQEAEVQETICQHLPDALGLPWALWSRAAVRALVEQRCGVRLAVRSAGTYLARGGFTAQKPLRRAYEQSAETVQRWLNHEYPAIKARARWEKGAVSRRKRSFAPGATRPACVQTTCAARIFTPRGRTPVVRPSHKRARLGPAKSQSDLRGISVVTNKGGLRWMLLDGAIKVPTLILFIQHLVRDAGCKVFLVLDNLPVHRARSVKDWLAEHRADIEVFHLSPYSPELNPDEGLSADLKQAVTRKPTARSKPELKRHVVGHMRSLSKQPDRIRSYFGHHTFRYAA